MAEDGLLPWTRHLQLAHLIAPALLDRVAAPGGPLLALLFTLSLSEPRLMRVAVAPAETLTVEVRGEGQPVVLIPGMFGSVFGYRLVSERIAESGQQAIVVEPLAFGTSSRPYASDYSLTAQSARIAAVLDSLGVRGAVVVSHSSATGMALRLALSRPDQVAAVISIEGGPTEAAATRALRRWISLAPLVHFVGGAGFVRGRIRSSLRAASGDPSWVTDEVIAHYTEGITTDLSATLRAYMRMADAREPDRLLPQLGNVHCPVLLMLGDAPHKDGPPADQVELLRASLPSFEVERVPGAGHYLHEERPDAVAGAVHRVGVSVLARETR